MTSGSTFVLTRRDAATVLITEVGAGESTFAVTDLASFVAEREPAGPRWVWDDTARWYPALLAAGVRVARCVDLRLQHAVLRRSGWVDQATMTGDDVAGWDALPPVVERSDALFDVHDHVASLDVLAEHTRQQEAVGTSRAPAALRLLLAAESAAALTAAEMTYVGLPWRAEVHRRILTEQLGPRPRPGARPPRLEPLMRNVRAALAAPTLNPDSPADLLAALQRAGIAVTDTGRGPSNGSTIPASPTCSSTSG